MCLGRSDSLADKNALAKAYFRNTNLSQMLGEGQVNPCRRRQYFNAFILGIMLAIF
jgi:hypothetical protein